MLDLFCYNMEPVTFVNVTHAKLMSSYYYFVVLFVCLTKQFIHMLLPVFAEGKTLNKIFPSANTGNNIWIALLFLTIFKKSLFLLVLLLIVRNIQKTKSAMTLWHSKSNSVTLCQVISCSAPLSAVKRKWSDCFYQVEVSDQYHLSCVWFRH